MAQERPWQDEDLLRRLYWEEGLDQYEIADELGCHQTTVKKWMKRHDINTRSQKYDISPTDIQEANQDHKTVSAIARHFDVSRMVIRKRIDEHDIDLDLTLRKYDISKEDLEELYYGEKLPVREIAEKYGCMPNTIREYMIEYGIERRDTSKALSLAKRSDVVFNIQYSYETISDRYDGRFFMHHRLLAVAEYGFDAVVGKDVHHKNELRWDNRIENIELVTKEEHIRIHQPRKDRS